MSERIYMVNINGGTVVTDVRLVKASNSAKAVRHVASKMIEAAVATQDDLVNLVGKGVKVEQASEAV